MAASDPKRSINFLHSRRSAKPNFCAIEIYEPVVGGLNLPANCGRWVRRRQRPFKTDCCLLTLVYPLAGPLCLLPFDFCLVAGRQGAQYCRSSVYALNSRKQSSAAIPDGRLPISH